MTVTCGAYTYSMADGINAQMVCDREPHEKDHHDSAKGHQWADSRFTLHLVTADGRFTVDVYERRGDLFEAREMNPDIRDAYEERIVTYERERRRMAEAFGLGAAHSHFRAATRVYMGGGNAYDALVACPEPADDKDQPAWDVYYVAERQAWATAIEAAALTLDERDVRLPVSIDAYMRSLYAGCLMCSCSAGYVCRDIIYPPTGGYPVDVSISVVG